MLATVFGDVHDIGKNLVNTILTNNGYSVVDLGKQVPMSVILDKAVEIDADAIGLSALLVSTSKQMPVCVAEQNARGSTLSGADRRRRDQPRFRAAHRVLDDERYFEPGVFYAKDAFEGLDIMDRLTGDARTALRVRARRGAARPNARARSARSRPQSRAAAAAARARRCRTRRYRSRRSGACAR